MLIICSQIHRGIQHLAELSNAGVEGRNTGPSVLAARDEFLPTLSVLSHPPEAFTPPRCLKPELAFLTYTTVLDACTVSVSSSWDSSVSVNTEFTQVIEMQRFPATLYPQLLSHLQFVGGWPKKDCCASKELYMFWRTLVWGTLDPHLETFWCGRCEKRNRSACPRGEKTPWTGSTLANPAGGNPKTRS